ncbi:chromosome segregation ATPase [Vibrio maritimus]|uniref:Chromosome segregation ATPase n=1 Tax=Vibrio maritimus TaxID=990268 RepID=A0A090T979_9VIBR|nr:chromosome segregation ATPase [Vibrio maritimus]
MDKQQQNQQAENDDVVVIEQKDNRARLYIGIAAVLGIATGGLIGASVTQNDWQQRYAELESRYQQTVTQTENHEQTLTEQLSMAESQAQLKLRKAVEEKVEEHQEQIAALEEQITKLEQDKTDLQNQLSSKKQQLVKQEKENTQLVRKNDIQSSMFEQSQELFKREAELKAEVAKLEQERAQITPNLERLKQDCDLYLEGTSWDAKSDSCERYDSATASLSQIEQMLKVHNMDLNHIATLKTELGIQ